MTWVMTVHSTGGSMGEAVDVIWAIGLHSEKAAKDLSENLNDIWAQRRDYECAQYFEVIPGEQYKLPLASAALMAQEGLDPTSLQAKGRIALDTGELARMLTEGEFPEVLPAPVAPPTPEEEQAAIDSILRTRDT